MTLENKLDAAIAMKQGFPEGSPGYLACQDEEMRIRSQLGDTGGPAPATHGGGPRANRVSSSGPRGFVEIDPEWTDGGMMHHPGYRDNRGAFDPAFWDPDRSEFKAYEDQVVMPPRSAPPPAPAPDVVQTSAPPPPAPPRRGPPPPPLRLQSPPEPGGEAEHPPPQPPPPRHGLGGRFSDSSVGRFLISRFESPQAALAWGVTAASVVYSGWRAYGSWKKRRKS